MVFIDPVGTPAIHVPCDRDLASKFFGVNGGHRIGRGIHSACISAGNERWSSPLFPGRRKAMGRRGQQGFSNHLFERGIGLNGILLILNGHEFPNDQIRPHNNDLPLVLILPSYATTAWYPQTTFATNAGRSLSKQIAQEARQFAAKRIFAGNAANRRPFPGRNVLLWRQSSVHLRV
jgi:hypothetical protein